MYKSERKDILVEWEFNVSHVNSMVESKGGQEYEVESKGEWFEL